MKLHDLTLAELEVIFYAKNAQRNGRQPLHSINEMVEECRHEYGEACWERECNDIPCEGFDRYMERELRYARNFIA